MKTGAQLSTWDWVIVAAYFALAIGLGIYLRRMASRGMTDYFLGGRKIPWWVIGASGTASNFDMTGTMVIVSFVFAVGLQGFWVSMRGGMCLPLGLLMVYMGKWLRRSNVITTAEWMQLRFGSGTQGRTARLLSGFANLVVALALLTYFVKGTGKFLAVFLPWSPEVCAVALVSVALVYTTLSGLYGVVFTDLAQELFIIAVAIFVGYQAFTLPDHEGILAFAGAEWSSFVPRWTAEPMSWLPDPQIYHFFGLCIVFWIARGLLEGAGGLTGGYMPQRYYAARSERDAGLMTAEWIVLLIFRWVLIVGVAVLGLSLARQNASIADLLRHDPEKTLPVVLGSAIPAVLRGLAVAGLLAAAMSTFDSTINAGASYWVRDVYQHLLRPTAPKTRLIRQGHLATVILALISIGLGFFVQNIDSIWSWITGPLSAGLFAPVVLRWYWWRLNGYGFAFSTAVGLTTAVLLRVFWSSAPLYLAFPVTWIGSLIAGIVVSLLTPATDPDTLRRFWLRVRPFGLWRHVRAGLDPEKIRRTKRENRWDLINIPLAIGFHLSGVVAIISLMLRKWDTLIIFLSLTAGLSVLLYFTWYRRLQSPESAIRAQRKDTQALKESP